MMESRTFEVEHARGEDAKAQQSCIVPFVAKSRTEADLIGEGGDLGTGQSKGHVNVVDIARLALDDVTDSATENVQRSMLIAHI